MNTTPDLFPGFTSADIPTHDGVTIRTRTGGSGPPLLLLHGHPQTHVIWHKVAPTLAQHFSLVLTDLRGYGDSSKPKGDADHGNYSRRTMARDMVQVMKHLGHDRFAVLAHDRGARVTHRMAVDHPQAVTRMVLLDIAPTLAMYEQTTESFARAYWHWFFLIQDAPLPERLIECDPKAYLRDVMLRRSAKVPPFAPEAYAEYERCLALPGAAHAMCEDYRAAASIDLEHDRADRDRGVKVAQPLMALWGERGIVERCFKPLECWQAVARNARGEALPSGHYIPEEVPALLLQKSVPFLAEVST